MAIRIGVCGIGRFSPGFVRFWNAHPMVEEVVISDLLSDRAQKLAEEVGVKRVFSSLDELCESDVDAIAIFTQRHLHAPMAVQAMEAGKDVYSAVPIGISMDEIEAVVDDIGLEQLDLTIDGDWACLAARVDATG